MSSWSDLERELGIWRSSGRTATLWWRDDDASRDTRALRHLLAIGAEQAIPIALAVVPAPLGPSLAKLLDAAPHAVSLQHGYSHADHAPAGERKAEFAPVRTESAMRADITRGLERLRDLPRFLPVFVPPWNRGLDVVRSFLGEIGFRGVSAFGPRAAQTAPPTQVNTHVDVIDWRHGRGFVGERRALDALVGHLRARRLETADADEPTGLLTHHLDHDQGCWDFLDRLFLQTSRAGVRWMDAREVFPA